MAPDDSELAVRRNDSIAGFQNVLLGWSSRLGGHVPLRIVLVVTNLRILLVDWQPRSVRLREMSDQRAVRLLYRFIDGHQHAVIRHQKLARFRSDLHSDVLPDLYTHCTLTKMPLERGDGSRREIR